jgi:hypothetical protein
MGSLPRPGVMLRSANLCDCAAPRRVSADIMSAVPWNRGIRLHAALAANV